MLWLAFLVRTHAFSDTLAEQAAEIEAFETLGLPEDLLEKIFFRNAKRLFGKFGSRNIGILPRKNRKCRA